MYKDNKKKQKHNFIVIIFASPAFLLGTEENFQRKYFSLKIFTFQWEHQNSEHTFISSILKVEETKVSSEF